MFIGYFKTPKPIRLVILPFVGLGLWLFSFAGSAAHAEEPGMPLFEMIFALSGIHPLINYIIGSSLVVIQAIILNTIIYNYQLLSTRGYVTALTYILLMSANPSLLSLYPVLPANLFLLFSLSRVFAAYRQERVFGQLFDAGLFVGIASLFYLPAILIFPFILVSISSLRPFAWRECVIPLIGLFVPYFFTFAIYIWTGVPGSHATDIVRGINPAFALPAVNRPNLFLAAVILIISIAAFWKFMAEFRTHTVKIQKLYVVLIWFFAFAICPFILFAGSHVYDLGIAAIPLSVYLANYFTGTGKPLVGELLFFTLLGAVIFVQIVNL